MVTSHEIFSKKSVLLETEGVITEQKKFADNSLFSKRIFGDMDSEEDYSCDCGALQGKFYEHCTCQKCDTEVQFIGMNINKFGWIDLSLDKYNEDGIVIEKGNGCHVIEYIAYSQLEKIIGRDNLRMIIQVKNTISISGEFEEDSLIELRNSNPAYKYYHIGIEEFYEKYNEVLDYYYNLKGNKSVEKLYQFLKQRDEVFTDKIPVISILLRPALRTADGLKLDTINIKYQNILKNLEILQDVNLIKIIKDCAVEQIQAEFMLLSEEILNAVKSKSGIIRNQICGTRINFSARNIISPAIPGVNIDELVMPYLTFLELYKFEIINILAKTENISLKEAEKKFHKAAIEYNEKIYLICQKMVQDNEVGVLLNRKDCGSIK
jgi:DNA-directed RNA polymerase beta' subunit